VEFGVDLDGGLRWEKPTFRCFWPVSYYTCCEGQLHYLE